MRETVRLEIPLRPGEKMDAAELIEAIEDIRVKALQLYTLEKDVLAFASYGATIEMSPDCTHLIIEAKVTPLPYQPATVFLH